MNTRKFSTCLVLPGIFLTACVGFILIPHHVSAAAPPDGVDSALLSGRLLTANHEPEYEVELRIERPGGQILGYRKGSRKR